MKFLLKIIFLTFNVSLLAGGTPLEIEISIGAGYDDNAMRFSDNEISEAAQRIGMMGGAKTFDSFITKWGISALKELMINRKKSIFILMRSHCLFEFNFLKLSSFLSAFLSIIFLISLSSYVSLRRVSFAVRYNRAFLHSSKL